MTRMSSKRTTYRVHVRAIRTRITDEKGRERVYRAGHIFEKPWPDLVAQAKADAKNRVLRIETIIKDEEAINDE